MFKINCLNLQTCNLYILYFEIFMITFNVQDYKCNSWRYILLFEKVYAKKLFVFFDAYFLFISFTFNKVMAVFYVRFSICKNSSVVSLWVRRVIYHPYLFLSPQLLSLYIFYCKKTYICLFSPLNECSKKTRVLRLFVPSLRWFLRHCRISQLRSLRRYTWH